MKNYRLGVEQTKEYFKGEFAKPESKTLLESRIPLFLEFKKVYFANRFSSESFAEFEISGIIINSLRVYYRELDPSLKWYREFIGALDKKLRLLSYYPLSMMNLTPFSGYTDHPNVSKEKQSIINRIHIDLNYDLVWDSRLEDLEAGPLKDSIIEQKKKIKTKYEERFKHNNDDRLFDYYAKSFESLKKDFPEIKGMIQDCFLEFFKGINEISSLQISRGKLKNHCLNYVPISLTLKVTEMFWRMKF